MDTSWMQQFVGTIAVCFAMLVVAAGDVPRPRGVPLSRAGLYNPTKDFTCFDGSSTIPFGQVNDDYCDCFDGSDEPGTSACINGIFHCTNAGHRAVNIPSSRVNDGVCDCCDGADEYWATGTKCPDVCDELGREARAEALRRSELLKIGAQMRHKLIDEGVSQRKLMAERLTQLEKDKIEAENMKAEKESLKSELERKENEVLKVYREAEEQARAKTEAEEKAANEQEAREIFIKFDSNSDGFLTADEIKTRNTFDKNKDGAIDEDETSYFLVNHDKVDIDLFVSESWSRVKPFLMLQQGLFKPQADSEAEQEELEDIDDTSRDEEEHLDDGEQETDDGEEEHESKAENIPEPSTEEPSQNYDPQTQEIVNAASEARRLHTEVERAVREIDSNIKTIKESLEKDYGPQQEFFTLDGSCFEYEDKEYVYKLCLFGRVIQKSKNGGHEVNLGNWGDWTGTEGNRYSAMKYTDGQSCWNGPNRSTHVNIDCGLETRVVSVSEPSRCEYLMELHTPAACDDSRATSHPTHDEL